jgi:predicted nucleic acid-binding protein
MRMRSFYLDASALAKRYAPEVGTLLVNYLFANVPTDRLCVFNIGIAEIVSLLVRKKNAGHLAMSLYSQALHNVGTELVYSVNLNRVEADTALVATALPLIERHSINATDAIILRSALDMAASLRSAGDDLVLVASDQRLLRAAQAEGLVTFNPETQSQVVLDTLLMP